MDGVDGLRLARLCAAVEAKMQHDQGALSGQTVLNGLDLLLSVMEASLPKPVRLAALDAARAVVEARAPKVVKHEIEKFATQRRRLLEGALNLLLTVQSPEAQWRCLRTTLVEGNDLEATARVLLGLWQSTSGAQGIGPRLAVLDVLLSMLRAVGQRAHPEPQPGKKKPHQQQRVAAAAAAAENLPSALLQCSAQIIQEAFPISELRTHGQQLLVALLRTGEPSALLQLPFGPQRILQLEHSEAEASTIPRTIRWDLLAEVATIGHCCSNVQLLEMCATTLLGIVERTDLLATATITPGRVDADLQQRLLRALHLMLLPPAPVEKTLQALPGLAGRFVEERLAGGLFVPLACTWCLHHEAHFLANAPPALAAALLKQVPGMRTARVRAAALFTCMKLLARGGAAEATTLLMELLRLSGELVEVKEKPGKQDRRLPQPDGKFMLPTLPSEGKLPPLGRAAKLLERALLPPKLLADANSWATQPQPGVLADEACERWFLEQFAAFAGTFPEQDRAQLMQGMPVGLVRKLQGTCQ